MALSHSILATLIGETPCSGYDLAKQFNSALGNFWKATHQQIYRELARLEADELVTSEVVPQDDRPDKKVYSVTEKGKKYLIDWIVEPNEPITTKIDLLAKFHVGYLVSPEVIMDEIERLKKIHEINLSRYYKLEEKYFHDPENMSLKRRFRYLNLRRGIKYEIAWIEWFDEAIELLSGMEDGKQK